ncbi:exo-1,4-beta-D-glucosaminidase [Gammaproteobacteria bacterium]
MLGSLTRAGKIQDPYFSDNLAKISEAPFKVPWWYRTEFSMSEDLPPDVRLVFEGVHYSAEVWLNGKKISEKLSGPFRVFSLDITSHVKLGTNVLAVLVYPPKPGDLKIGFVDWTPVPPDQNLGLWREVKLRITQGVSLEAVYARGEPDSLSSHATLLIGARVTNHTGQPVVSTIRARVESISVEQKISLGPNESRDFQFSSLILENPRLWWPNQLGAQERYHLLISADINGKPSDQKEIDFGIRKVEDFLNEVGARGFKINGKPFLVRGAGWVDDLLLSQEDQNLEDQIRYAKHLNLNTLRLEGFWGSTQKLYDLADQYGLLIMVGWSCQWEWKHYLGRPTDPNFGGVLAQEEMDLAAQSLQDQVILLRNHPSVLAWFLGSDMPPKPELERRYRKDLARIDPGRPALSHCRHLLSQVSGPSGFRNAPYDWEPPNHWYEGEMRGIGFDTETAPGAQPPVLDSLKRMLPKEHLWPIDEIWNYHCGRNEFNSLASYLEALNARYGVSNGIEEFSKKAQIANYEAMRPLFESFSLYYPKKTGVIQWMLNSAWPEMYWQLYDKYLVPNAAFYATRLANRPVHVILDPVTRQIGIVNDTPAPITEALLSAKIFSVDSKKLWEGKTTADLVPWSRTLALSLPTLETGRQPYFVDLRLMDLKGSLLASNFYWLPAEPDVLDQTKNIWFVTPTQKFADLSTLSHLPPATIQSEARFSDSKGGQTVEVTLQNVGSNIAFFIELAVVEEKSGHWVAPIYWDDNYLSLLPGETRVIRGWFPSRARNHQKLSACAKKPVLQGGDE